MNQIENVHRDEKYADLVGEIRDQYTKRVMWLIGGGCFFVSLALLMIIQYAMKSKESDVVIIAISAIGGVINSTLGVVSAWMAKDMMVKYLLVQERLVGDVNAYESNSVRRAERREAMQRVEESSYHAVANMTESQDKLVAMAAEAVKSLTCTKCGAGLSPDDVEPIENDYLMCVVKCGKCEAELLLDTLQREIVESA